MTIGSSQEVALTTWASTITSAVHSGSGKAVGAWTLPLPSSDTSDGNMGCFNKQLAPVFDFIMPEFYNTVAQGASWVTRWGGPMFDDISPHTNMVMGLSTMDPSNVYSGTQKTVMQMQAEINAALNLGCPGYVLFFDGNMSSSLRSANTWPQPAGSP